MWDLFLQMLDAARITLADHQVYNLCGFYIVCTSNIGSERLLRPTRLPLTTLERAVISELHKFFRPELIGRFDEKIVFQPLSFDTHATRVADTVVLTLPFTAAAVDCLRVWPAVFISFHWRRITWRRA